MRGKYDILWKGMLEEIVEDLLRFVEPEIDRELDLRRGFEFLDKELGEIDPEPEEPSDTLLMDKLVKVYTRGGTAQWVLIHLEIQGKYESDFPKRMFRYYYRVHDGDHGPVAAIAILTGRDGKRVPGTYEERCLWTRVTYEYKTLCVTDYPKEELERSTNLFALVLLVAWEAILRGKETNEEWVRNLLEHKMQILNLLDERLKFGERKYNAILDFLYNYVSFKNPEINAIFRGRIDKKTGKTDTMGIIEQLAEIRKQEGRAEGAEEATQRIVRNLLMESDFPLEKIASLANVSLESVRKIKEKLPRT
jgi:hypothetical protein